MNNKGIIFVCCLLAITVGLLIFIRTGQQDATSDILSQKNETQQFLHLAFLDIGQGDATLLTFPDGQQMLVDCAIDARILEALGRQMPFYDRTIEYLVMTHPDMDHYGGCIDVLERFDVAHVVHSGFTKQQEYFDAFLAAVEAEKAEVEQVTELKEWQIASTTLQFLHPDYDVATTQTVPGTEIKLGANDASVVIKLTYGTQDILLMGDIEEVGEKYLLTQYPDLLDVEILKAGHHGSSGSSHQAFLDMTSPEHVMFSAGKGNRYGHPSRRVMRRVERIGATSWRTDTQGDILLMVSPEKSVIETVPTGY